jgi:hypothetical protein
MTLKSEQQMQEKLPEKAQNKKQWVSIYYSKKIRTVW